MPNNFTEHIQLNQWEPGDAVRRTDFNEDNAKLDTAVGESLDEVRTLRRVVTNLAYHVGQLSVVDSLNRGVAFSSRAVIYDSFLSPGNYICTGGVTIANHRAKLSGAGASGTILTSFAVSQRDCKQMQLWAHYKGGSLGVLINNTPMTYESSFSDKSATGGNCDCRVFTWTGKLSGMCDILLQMDCGSDGSMELYDYFLAYL